MPQISFFFCRVVYKPQRTLMQQGYDFDIKNALDPSVTISRYNRTWRLSRPKTYDTNFLVGKLGFESLASEKKTYYDETQKDFVEQSVDARQGHYVQWAIDLSTHIMAFETKPPDIKYQSFIGAFKELLDKRPDISLTLEKIVESAKFFEWAKNVDRITKFTANLRAPNPNFENRPKIILDLLQDTNGDYAKVEISKEQGSKESLNTDKTIRVLVEYGEDGYSTIVAHGLSKSGQTKLFDSKRGMPVDRVDISVPTTVEKVWARIIDVLKRFKHEAH